MSLSISAFFPAYNDEHTIEAMVRGVESELKSLTDEFEIVVVNDGSQDGTGALLDRLLDEIPSLRVIHHRRNLGYGAALITGFRACRNELVFYTDGDGQYDVRELPIFVRNLTADIDVLNGYKLQRADGWHRVFLGEVYRRGMKWAFSLPVRDVDCDFRLLRRDVLDALPLRSHSGVICVEMIRRIDIAGFTIGELPVTHLPRMHGSSQFFRFRHLSRVLGGLCVVWWNLVLMPWLGLAPDGLRAGANGRGQTRPRTEESR